MGEVAASHTDAQKFKGQVENARFKSQLDSMGHTGILSGMYTYFFVCI